MSALNIPNPPGELDFNSPFEYWDQEANTVLYYIEGKSVCITQSGTMLWCEMPQDQAGCFHVGEMIENQYLESDFTDKELAALQVIKDLDKQANEYELHVVTTINAGERQYLILYSDPSETYWQVDLDDLARVNLITANLMAQAKETNYFTEAYPVRLDERGVPDPIVQYIQ